MKLSLNWVREYCDIPEISTKELAQATTLKVCEVEGYIETGKHLKDILSVKILEVSKHTNSDKLKLVTVTDGKENYRVVCGADNFSKGDIVAFAPVGSVLPGDFKIKKAKIRGEESFGMLCSEMELELSNNHEGIMILPSSTEIGKSLNELFPDAVDIILEIDNKSLTHRPDLWGHYGFAREYSVLFDCALKPMCSDISKTSKNGETPIKINVEKETEALRFSALGITNLSVKPSSDIVRHRLFRVGLRPINNLVDVTNYVMLEYGQPMHAFDMNEIPGKCLNVKNAIEGEKLLTLQQKEAELNDSDVVIYDGEGPTALAGVIGGMRSGITDSTSALLLEAGTWNPVRTRRTSTRLGVRTDAAQRYEKSLDPALTGKAISRSLEILHETCPELRQAGDFFDFCPAPIDTTSVKLTDKNISRILGIELQNDFVEKTLSKLGFELERKNTYWNVKIPSWRATKDISIEADLIEEIGRFYGYNNIEPEAPKFPIEKPEFNKQRLAERNAKLVLSENGFFEVFTYPLAWSSTEEEFFCIENQRIDISNPVAENLNILRTDLFPGMVKAVAEGQKIATDFSYFEIGRIYGQTKMSQPFENDMLSMGVSRDSSPEDTFRISKLALNRLFGSMGISAKWKPAIKSDLKPYMHPYRSAVISCSDDILGHVFMLHPEFLSKWNLKNFTCFSIVNFKKIFHLSGEVPTLKIGNIVKFPPVLFDISIKAEIHQTFGFFSSLIRSFDKRIENVSFLDVFYPKDLEGMKSMTVSIHFRNSEKTIDTNEANELRNLIIKKLEENGYHLR